MLKLYEVPRYNIKVEKCTYIEDEDIENIERLLKDDHQYHERLSENQMLILNIDLDNLKQDIHIFQRNLCDFLSTSYGVREIDVERDISYTKNYGKFDKKNPTLLQPSYHLTIPKLCATSSVQKHFWTTFKTLYQYGKEIDYGHLGAKGKWMRLPNQTKEKKSGTEHKIIQGQLRDFVLQYIHPDAECLDTYHHHNHARNINLSVPTSTIILENNNEVDMKTINNSNMWLPADVLPPGLLPPGLLPPGVLHEGELHADVLHADVLHAGDLDKNLVSRKFSLQRLESYKTPENAALIDLLTFLNPRRYDEYNEWINIGLCIFSLYPAADRADRGDRADRADRADDVDGLTIWDELSKQSEKYDSTGCGEKYPTFKDKYYKIEHLLNLVIVDQPDKYIEIHQLHAKYKESMLEIINLQVSAKDDQMKATCDFITSTCTHISGAEMFARHTDGEIFFTKAFRWIIFDRHTKIWSYNNDENSLVYPVCKFFTTLIHEYVVFLTERRNQKLSRQEEITSDNKKHYSNAISALAKVGNSQFARGVIQQLQSLLTEHDSILDKFDAYPNIFAFSDGKVVDLFNAGKVRKIIKEDYIITTCGYEYPDGCNPPGNEKLAYDFVHSLSEDEELTKSLLTMLSCSMLGQNRNDLFFVWTGKASNGKGTLDTALQAVLGRYYCAVDSSQLTSYEKDSDRPNSQLASTRFSRCVMATEPESSDRKDTFKVSTIKKLTGGDKIRTRFLHQDTFEFVPRFVLFCQTNDIPNLSKKDDGIVRRMKIVEFPLVFKKNPDPSNCKERRIDVTLKEKLKTDVRYRNGLLMLLIKTWVANNGSYYEPPSVSKITTEYLLNQNPLRDWFQENYEADGKGELSSQKIYDHYQNFDREINLHVFQRYLGEICTKRKGKGGRMLYLCVRRNTYDKSPEHFRIFQQL